MTEIETTKITNYYEYFLTFDKAAAELRRLEAEKDHDIEHYYLMGFSLDGQTRGLTFDELKAEIFGEDREAVSGVMTEQELEAIRQRAEQATPGPWSMKQEGADFYMADSQGRYLDITLADAIFAAHSRQDIPALLAEVERLRADIEHVSTVGESLVVSLDSVKADNARLRAAIVEIIADVRGAQFTDNTWKEAEAEKRGILAGLENALKGGAKLQELIKDAKSMCVICGGPDWTHGARNHEYKGGNS